MSTEISYMKYENGSLTWLVTTYAETVSKASYRREDGEMELTRRRRRRRKKILDDLQDRRGYSHLKEEALDRTMWRNRFGSGFGPVVRQKPE
jgi:hypothetical protein